jgi:hypothetical protein
MMWRLPDTKELSANLCLHGSYGFHQTGGLFWGWK